MRATGFLGRNDHANPRAQAGATDTDFTTGSIGRPVLSRVERLVRRRFCGIVVPNGAPQGLDALIQTCQLFFPQSMAHNARLNSHTKKKTGEYHMPDPEPTVDVRVICKCSDAEEEG